MAAFLIDLLDDEEPDPDLEASGDERDASYPEDRLARSQGDPHGDAEDDDPGEESGDDEPDQDGERELGWTHTIRQEGEQWRGDGAWVGNGEPSLGWTTAEAAHGSYAKVSEKATDCEEQCEDEAEEDDDRCE